MTNNYFRLGDLDSILRGDEFSPSDSETARHRVLNQIESAPSDLLHASDELQAIRQRLEQKERQLRTLQQELRLRDERISQLERLGEECHDMEDHDKAHGIQSDQVGAMGLVLESVCDPAVTHRISGITTAIGRAAINDVVLDTSSVSRSHARIVVASNSVYLIDLGSTNGCSVNGKRVSRQMLNCGDIITFGDVQYRFVTGAFLSEDDSRWMDETQVLLDESVVFTRSPAPKTNTELELVAEEPAKVEQIKR